MRSLTEPHYTLTTPQQNIQNLEKYYPGTSIANVGGLLCFTSHYDYEALNRAVNLLVENNDALRLRFSELDGQPCQTVAPYQPEQITEHDMRGKSQADIDTFISSLMQEPHTTMLRAAAVRLDGGRCGYFLSAHHLCCDAWGISIIAKELIRYFCGGEPNPLPSFLDAVASEQNYFDSPRYQKDKAY